MTFMKIVLAQNNSWIHYIRLCRILFWQSISLMRGTVFAYSNPFYQSFVNRYSMMQLSALIELKLPHQ